MIHDFFEKENIADETILIDNDPHMFTEADDEDDSSLLKDLTGIDPKTVKDDWNGDEMNKPEVIAKDIAPGVSGTIDNINSMLGHHRVDNRSIVARAKNSICQFPIYISQTIGPNEAHIISKMFERYYTTLIQTAVAQNPILDQSEVNNMGFLKSYHTNIRESVKTLINEYYEPIDEFDKLMCESIYCKRRLNKFCVMESCVVPISATSDLALECKRLANEPLTGFSYLREADGGNSVNKVTLTSQNVNNSMDVLSEDDLRRIAANEIGNLTHETMSQNEISLLSTTPERIRKDVEASTIGSKKDPNYQSVVQKAYDQRISERDAAVAKVDRAVTVLKNYIKQRPIPTARDNTNPLDAVFHNLAYNNGRFVIINKSDTKRTEERLVEPKAQPAPRLPVRLPEILHDSDIKKINGMLPYTIQVNFRVQTPQGLDRDVSYLIGIKSILHRIEIRDLQEELRELVTGNIKGLQKVRYKTGEISLKDYLFNPKGLKADAAKNINYNKKWITTLKRLAETSNGLQGTLWKHPSKLITGGTTPIPNGTLVISRPDVSTLIGHTGIDIEDITTAKLLAKNLFLLAIAIIDSTAGVMKVMFTDSDGDWDVQSLASVDAEIAKTDNSQLMKELNRVVNR